MCKYSMFFTSRKIFIHHLPTLRKMFYTNLPALRKMLAIFTQSSGAIRQSNMNTDSTDILNPMQDPINLSL